MFANFDYPISRRAVPRDGRRARRTAGAGRPGAGGRAWRCCAATARSSSRWRCSASIPALGRGELFGELLPGLVARERRRRGLRALGPVRRRAAVPSRSRHRQLLRRGRLPPAARGRPPRERALRRRVPGLLQRAPRRRDRGDAAAASARPRPSTSTRGWKAGVPARRRRRTGTSRTSATTTSGCCSTSTRPSCAATDRERYLELSRAGDGRGDGGGVRRVAPRRLALRRRARAVAARPAGRAPAGA